MDFKTFKRIIEDNNIPDDVHLMSDSGWECDATEMDGVYYNRSLNLIVFTQERDRGYETDDKDKGLYDSGLITEEFANWKYLGIK